jgi:hypothetical protein
MERKKDWRGALFLILGNHEQSAGWTGFASQDRQALGRNTWYVSAWLCKRWSIPACTEHVHVKHVSGQGGVFLAQWVGAVNSQPRVLSALQYATERGAVLVDFALDEDLHTLEILLK